jgi:hypothetical protein
MSMWRGQNAARFTDIIFQCPRCLLPMSLCAIEPDPVEEGVDLRTFECAPCDRERVVKVKYR